MKSEHGAHIILWGFSMPCNWGCLQGFV